MIQKVLVSDDLASINLGIRSVLDRYGIHQVDSVHYCDDAFLRLKRAALDGVPFDLLITDLSFKPDHREQTYASGPDLIAAVKAVYPDLKVIVYSVEDRVQRVRHLMEFVGIDAYVCKGRRGLIELAKAFEAVVGGGRYVSPFIGDALRGAASFEIEDYDIKLLELLSKGYSQDDISSAFKQQQVSPSSLSSIEKRINRLRIQLKAQNVVHLVSTAKDLGFI